MMSLLYNGMATIYIREGEYQTGEKGWPLIQRAAANYIEEKHPDLLSCLTEYIDGRPDSPGHKPDSSNLYNGENGEDVFDIEVDSYGKPFFKYLSMDFSLSHSGAMWMCAFSLKPCGLDVQERKRVNWESVSRRHYHPAEKEYVEAKGEDAFFKIWVRKEALGKIIGRGILGEMPPVVSEDGELLKRIELDGGSPFMREIEISDDIFCAICTYDEEEDFRLI